MSTSSRVESGGLTDAEASRRFTDDGPNAVPAGAPTTLAARVLAQLRDPMILLLGAAWRESTGHRGRGRRRPLRRR